MPDPPADGGPRRPPPTRWSDTDRLRAAEEAGPPPPRPGARPPDPFTVPDGWRPPSLSEQWVYANRRHPYKNYGVAGALLLGGVAWWAARGVRGEGKGGKAGANKG